MQLTKTKASGFLGLMMIILMTGLSFVSCSKNNDDNPQAPVSAEGLYSGKYGYGNDVPDQAYKLNFKAGGILQEIGINSGAITGQGTWQMNGNVITGTYTMAFAPHSVYSVSGIFDEATGKITGTWGYDNSTTDGGKIDLIRL